MTTRVQCPGCGGLMAIHARVCRVCMRGPEPEIHESWSWPVVRLAQAMRDRGVTVEELATKSGVPTRTITYGRAGCAMSRQNAMAIAQVLRISPVSMLAVVTNRGTYHTRRKAPDDGRQTTLDLNGGE